MLRVVQLQDFHEKNGHLVEFAEFNLPLWFKGIIPESLAVRNAAGIFDVSHMGRAIINGKDAQKLLDKITTNDVASLADNHGQYSLMCNADGGIRDDVLVFRLKGEEYLIVYNAGNRSRDYAWIKANAASLDVDTMDVSDEVAMFAVQGPEAIRIVQQLVESQLDKVDRFGCEWVEIKGAKVLVSRTGYTGEDGFELYVWDSPIGDPRNARVVWERVMEAGKPHGLEPCGLGARDLLRLEAGLCLYGTDMDESTNPYEAKLGFVVKLRKEFIGKNALEEIKENGVQKMRVGMVTAHRVIPRHGFNIIQNETKIGTITSGTLSPLLNAGIAMGYVGSTLVKEGDTVKVQIRDRQEQGKVVKMPFYDTSIYGYTRRR